jgi:glutathione S-transferase
MSRLRLLEIPYSTNVERVTLALAHKGLSVEHVVIDPLDRSAAVAASGQPLVPVLVLDGGEVVADSTTILRRLERDHPDPPLWPADPARAAELDVFASWFNDVWKRPPNAIVAEEESARPDARRLAELWARLRGALHVFDRLLDGRPYLYGDELTAADLLAFPFLKYAAHIDPADDERFHQVLHEGQPLADHPRIAAWIDRIDALPRA